MEALIDRVFTVAEQQYILPAESEIDASIIYADYYYMEALLRLKRLTENKPVIDE